MWGGREVVAASSILRCAIMTFSKLQTSSGYVGAYHLQKTLVEILCVNIS